MICPQGRLLRFCSLTLLFCWAPMALADSGAEGKLWVFIGTYTGGKSKGIYRCELDPAAGKLTTAELAAETTNPSYLTIHPDRHFLYCVGEISDFKGKPSGAVSAYSLDPRTGRLSALNQKPSGGAGPCYIASDKEGRHVLVANYGGGSASVLALDADGSLGTQTAFVQHKGTGSDPKRQEGPHAHSINLDPANRFAFVADLGLDQVFVYKYDTIKGTLSANEPPSVTLAPGSGPRHLDFHPNGKFAYVINEMASTITALNYDADRGVLTQLQTVSTLPKDFKGNNTTADIHVHPSGKFLYGSNRGHDSIALFRIDEKTGELTAAGQVSTHGKTPRNFGLDPSGKYLLAANQDSGNVVLFRIDQNTGELEATGETVEVSMPVCVKMVRIEP